MLELITKLQVQLQGREEGQALVEYALILALISVVAIGALTLIGTNVTAILNSVANALKPAA
jgi:pilus assembly protein Flp/PilA